MNPYEELARRLRAAFVSAGLRNGLDYTYRRLKEEPVSEYWLALAERVYRDGWDNISAALKADHSNEPDQN